MEGGKLQVLPPSVASSHWTGRRRDHPLRPRQALPPIRLHPAVPAVAVAAKKIAEKMIAGNSPWHSPFLQL